MASRAEEYAGLQVVDSVRFATTRLLPQLDVVRPVASLTVHPTCSSTRLGVNEDLLALSRAIAKHVHVPTDFGCCAFAGDRGLLHPELTASATAAEAAQVRAEPTEAYASVNRTCEIGMTRATGQPYRTSWSCCSRRSRDPDRLGALTVHHGRSGDQAPK